MSERVNTGEFPTQRCVHLGKTTGEIVTCRGCNRVYSVPIFSCELHERCTLTKLASNPTIHCCRICKDHETL